MDEPEALRTRQLVWELVAPLLDRIDALSHEVQELRRRVEEHEQRLPAAPAAALPPAGSGEGRATE
jgi:hypothetical protein